MRVSCGFCQASGRCGITESLWRCPLRAAVTRAKNLLGPQLEREEGVVRGLDGAEGGLCVEQKSACVTKGVQLHYQLCEKCGIKTVNVAVE